MPPYFSVLKVFSDCMGVHLSSCDMNFRLHIDGLIRIYTYVCNEGFQGTSNQEEGYPINLEFSSYHCERSHKYTVQDRYSTVSEQLTARRRTVNISSREQPGVARS